MGFSPCRKEDRQTLIDILEGVENIPGSALAEGMKWKWETFPEYMNFLGKLKCATDFCVMIGHVPIRLYVMGKDRCHDKARKEDLVKMREIVAEAVRAGALGVSTSRTLLHRDLQGVVIPGSYVQHFFVFERFITHIFVFKPWLLLNLKTGTLGVQSCVLSWLACPIVMADFLKF